MLLFSLPQAPQLQDQRGSLQRLWWWKACADVNYGHGLLSPLVPMCRPLPPVGTSAREEERAYGSSLCFPGCLYLYSVLCSWGKPADTFIHPIERLPGGEELKEVSILAQRKRPVAPQLCSHVPCACLLSASGRLGQGGGAGSRNHAVCAQLEPKCLCPGVHAWQIIWVCTHDHSTAHSC